MRRFIVANFFSAFAISTVLGAIYDDPITRYKFWPMASAAYSDHPEVCVKDNFANSEVGVVTFIS